MPLGECGGIPVRLTSNNENDSRILQEETLAAIRKVRIDRQTHEAKDKVHTMFRFYFTLANSVSTLFHMICNSSGE